MIEGDPADAGLVGDDDELGGQRADEESLRDLVVGQTLGGQCHHLAFAGREFGEEFGGRQVSAGLGNER